MFHDATEYQVRIPIGEFLLPGILEIPKNSEKMVIFVHGSGSSRLSPRNTFVAKELRKQKIATLLVDLLSPAEDEIYSTRFDIPLLTQRVGIITQWVQLELQLGRRFSYGYFGASTGAAAALNASVVYPLGIKAIVSRGGRPDLALDILPQVHAPTLLVVGGEDTEVIQLNKKAYNVLTCEKKLEIIEGATHLFEEKGTLEKVTNLAANWFQAYL